jgi:DNA-binding LacI/PurR family transcriptional regulator
MAEGCLVVAHEAGIAVPEQLPVAGFDDSYLAQIVWPPLTSCSHLIGRPVRKQNNAVASTHRTRHHGSAAQISRLIFPTHSTGVFALSRAAERFVRTHDLIIRKLNECIVDSVNIDF